jgi:hypothetical protein
MSTYKIVNDNYTINCGLTGNAYTGVFTVNAANIQFNGNITTTGSNTTVFDFITVAANNTGAITDMGLLGQTSANTYAGLRFDTVANTWQISSSVTNTGTAIAPYANLLTTGGNIGAAGSDTQIQFNKSGVFGANVNLTYDYANSILTIQGTQVLGNIGTTPSTPSNAVALYNNTIGGGGTGLYVLSSGVNQELVSKSKAIVYGIIF